MSAMPTDIALALDVPARFLDFGAQRRIEIGRSLLSRPQILLLDEPSAGFDSHESSALFQLVSRLQTAHHWSAFLLLGSAAAIARLFRVRTPGEQAYHTDIIFLIPAALILPPELLVLIAVAYFALGPMGVSR